MTPSDAIPETGSTAELDADYQRAGFGASLPFGERPALIIVDVVKAYTTEGSPLYAKAFVDVLGSNRRLIAAAREAGVPVIFTGVVYAPDGHDGGRFFQKVPALRSFIKGSPMAEFCEGIEPHANETIVLKQYASSFFGTSLAATLTAMRVDTVMITGYSTSGCVRATTLDAMQCGFIPFVIRDACADRDERPHESNLFDLQAKYAEVVDEKRALAEMSRVAQQGRVRRP